jgi:phage terminase large subunit GpA-like protein
MRERNEALDCYVYARAAAAASGLDRFEERHWRELEKQFGIASADPPESNDLPTTEATDSGGLAVSGTRSSGRPPRHIIRSRWLT